MKEIQNKVEQYFKKGNFEHWPKFVILARLEEEISEIARIISVKEGYREQHKIDNMDLEDEFGDAMFQLIHLANSCDINLDKAMKRVLEKYGKYQFNGLSNKIIGTKPDFKQLILSFSNKELRLLDLGCGSGELTNEISDSFKEVVGVDYCEEYINSAGEKAKFLVANANELPFDDEEFDIIISSRGPVSENENMMKETLRVCKKGGLIIEETIGEKDKIKIKEKFGRGQNYPIKEKKLTQVENLLKDKAEMIAFSEYYYQKEFTYDKLLTLLERAPIIPDFDKENDKEIIEEYSSEDQIMLIFHRLHWIAKKN